MWIKKLPSDYYNRSSLCYNNVFMWQAGNVFVMDNHMSALWGWLQVCDPKKSYNFMHIDRHYDLSDSFKDEDLVALKQDPHLSYENFVGRMRWDGKHQLLRWDNYIMAGYSMHPRWYHTNVFLTCGEGNKDASAWGHAPMKIREENPLFMEWCIEQYVGEPYKYLDGFKGNDYKLPWIVNLDLDVFYTADSHIQAFSDDYIRRVAEILQKNINRIAVLTIAVSPECLGGEEQRDKWGNGFRLLRVMSKELKVLGAFNKDMKNAVESPLSR